MSTTQRVDFGGVHVRGAWASPAVVAEAELAVYTRTGQARIATLSYADLVRLNEEVAIALRQLRTNEIARAGAELRPVPKLDTSARAMLDER
jgi:hypothetical protein